MKRWLLRLAISGFLALFVAAGAAWFGWRWLQDEWHSPWPTDTGALPTTSISVVVEPGTSARAILEQLEEAGVLRSAERARWLLVYPMEDPPLRAGEYRFELPLSAQQALQKLVEGDVVTYPVTVIEGLTMAETATTLADAGLGSKEQFLQQMSDPARIRDLDPMAENLEGYLYPDTYRFPRGTSEGAIVDAMVLTFRRRLAELDLDTEKRSVRDLVKLASLVEKEAKLEEERPLIASVYANRLRIGMALYADPTIIYGLKLDGTWDGNLTRTHLRAESPWNSYRVAGLPPTPICSPRLDSLQAALAPADTEYLYFVSRNDGSHVFASKLSEHNRNVERWQRRYWREKWRKERQAKAQS